MNSFQIDFHPYAKLVGYPAYDNSFVIAFETNPRFHIGYYVMFDKHSNIIIAMNGSDEIKGTKQDGFFVEQ